MDVCDENICKAPISSDCLHDSSMNTTEVDIPQSRDENGIDSDDILLKLDTLNDAERSLSVIIGIEPKSIDSKEFTVGLNDIEKVTPHLSRNEPSAVDVVFTTDDDNLKDSLTPNETDMDTMNEQLLPQDACVTDVPLAEIKGCVSDNKNPENDRSTDGSMNTAEVEIIQSMNGNGIDTHGLDEAVNQLTDCTTDQPLTVSSNDDVNKKESIDKVVSGQELLSDLIESGEDKARYEKSDSEQKDISSNDVVKFEELEVMNSEESDCHKNMVEEEVHGVISSLLSEVDTKNIIVQDKTPSICNTKGMDAGFYQRRDVLCKLLGYDSTDSSTDSESSSDVDSVVINSDITNCDHKSLEVTSKNKKFNKDSLAKTEGEIDVIDLPKIQNLEISVANSELQHIGDVMCIVDCLVVVQSLVNCPPLNLESVMFLENGAPLGVVFDVFGPVVHPLYSIRFNSESDIAEKKITVGLKVYYAPLKKEYTTFVFAEHLRKQKGSDASWEHNNEPPVECLEYSDDEEEKLALAHLKNLQRRTDLVQDDAQTKRRYQSNDQVNSHSPPKATGTQSKSTKSSVSSYLAWRQNMQGMPKNDVPPNIPRHNITNNAPVIAPNHFHDMHRPQHRFNFPPPPLPYRPLPLPQQQRSFTTNPMSQFLPTSMPPPQRHHSLSHQSNPWTMQLNLSTPRTLPVPPLCSAVPHSLTPPPPPPLSPVQQQPMHPQQLLQFQKFRFSTPTPFQRPVSVEQIADNKPQQHLNTNATPMSSVSGPLPNPFREGPLVNNASSGTPTTTHSSNGGHPNVETFRLPQFPPRGFSLK